MKNHLFLLLLPLGISLFYGCGSQKGMAAGQTPKTEEEMAAAGDLELRELDTLVVSAPAGTDAAPESFSLPRYNPSSPRTNDLLHTRLELRFDWEKEQVLGKATLRFKPYFLPTDRLTLDAKGFEFHEVRLDGKNRSPLKYEYDGEQVLISLDRSYNRNEEYTVFIDYTASPKASGGSEAITSDQGLFFIKPDSDDPAKPRQIWTQGETNWNSRWFPTIDKPNERCTQEMYLTVTDSLETLSNGILVSSKKNADGTRTDYWKMDQPHAPYLFMIAVGDYAIVRDKWENIPVSYYVEHDFEKDARAIFPHTPEMLQFFSTKLNVKYPWPKYDQVIVRDYVSGAMENTTAVVFGEFMQKHRADLISELDNEKVVAHEMFHHWFGDLVTCESWANLTLNEGFANYSEYLWLEHKYGRDEADFHLFNEWNGYLGEAASQTHPLIHYGYENNENMFDAHSYNKGGSVLHMLRHQVGDEAFFTGLNRYLVEHAYSSVEVHDLRQALEAVTGEDLNWFFDQWYLKEGHPELSVTFGYDTEKGEASVTVEQTQDPQKMPAIFQLPTSVDIYLAEGQAPLRRQVRVTERKQTFSFAVPSEPKLMIFDPEHALLAPAQVERTEEELVFMYDHAPRLLDRLEAVQRLQQFPESKAAALVQQKSLADPFWYIRGNGISNLDSTTSEASRNIIRKTVASDPHAQVRAVALTKLAELQDQSAVELARKAIDSDSSSTVVASGFDVLIQLDKPSALQYAQKLEKTGNPSLLSSIGSLYLESGDAGYLPFFERHLNKMEGYAAFDFYNSYLALAIKTGTENQAAAVKKFLSIGSDMSESPWRRLATMSALNQWRTDLVDQGELTEDRQEKQKLEEQIQQITGIMKQIASAETSEQLKGFYEQILNE